MYNNIYYSSSDINILKDTISKEMEFYETESLPALENSLNIREAFMKLINLDKDLYNKILQYEPINIENLHSTLRTHGFKCNLPNLMNFLDEQVHIFVCKYKNSNYYIINNLFYFQCITFYIPEQNNRSKIHRRK